MEFYLIQTAIHFVGPTRIQFFHKYQLPKNVFSYLSNAASQKWDNAL